MLIFFFSSMVGFSFAPSVSHLFLLINVQLEPLLNSVERDGMGFG